MLRLQEDAGAAAEGVQLSNPLAIFDTKLAKAVEEFTGSDFDLSIFSMEPWQTQTVRVRGRDRQR